MPTTMNGLFLVESVLRGDSADAMITGVDAEGRRARIEVPTAMAAPVRPGSALLLQWWTAEVPMVPGAVAADLASEVDSEAAEGSAEPETEAELDGDARVEREFRALIGLP